MTAAGAVAASTRRKGRASKVGCFSSIEFSKSGAFLPLSFHPFGMCTFFKKDSTWKHSLALRETIAFKWHRQYFIAWQLQIITNQSVEVAARAEVAPGEKVVGIDLGTTNSAVAAMEVLKLSDYLKI